MAAANDWKDMLVEMIGDTDDKDVFNVDETGLFYKCTSDKTMTFKKETLQWRTTQQRENYGFSWCKYGWI